MPGAFWFPDRPENHFQGELNLELDYSYNVELHLSKEDRASSVLSEDRILGKHFTLFGESRQGQPISLLACGCSQPISYNPRRELTGKQISFFVNVIVIGSHVPEIREARFKRLSVFFHGFNQWAGTARLAMGIGLEDLERRTLVEQEIEGLGTFGIYCEGWDKPTHAETDESLTVRYWMPSFAFLEPISFDEGLRKIRCFQGLLCLLFGYAIGFDEVQSSYLRSVGSGKAVATVATEIEIIPRMTGYQRAFRRTGFSLTNISFRAIKNILPEVIRNWLTFYDKMEDVFNLYLTVVLAPDLADHHKFLFLAQCIEGFHRARPDSKDKKFTPAEYKRRKAKVLESAPETEREWLTDALEYPPGNTLLERLDEILKPLKDLIADSFDDLDLFRLTVKNARNYLTHPGNIEPQNYDYRDLWKKLRTILEICFLQEIGVPERVYAVIAIRHRFRYD
jgi:hypothetical protein